MILILEPDADTGSDRYERLIAHLESLDDITFSSHEIQGTGQRLTEIYLLGNTAGLSVDTMRALPLVERVIRVQDAYRILGRHRDEERPSGFDYNGVTFSQDTLHVFAGLCAVDTMEHVDVMMRTLSEHGQVTTRMGAYKPRTSPYSFQGHGADCLPWVFELAGKHGIRVIAMEVTHDAHVDEIDAALETAGRPTGVMLQIGTRNTQNFELLKAVGRQKRYPVLFKRGFGITLDESLNAAEYLASEGNPNVVFALRGVKTSMGDPHRNMVDFAHVPVLKRLTRMPVCVDPSHSVGGRERSPEGLLDVMHVTAQGVIAGANMVLVDFHPAPSKALVDGPQALRLDELGWFLDDVAIAREAYEKRIRLAASRADG
ncbi:MAG: 3-deoxy-7-phosphoheptulonate synthase [Rhodothermales bacterium]|nr:3-deoxy-7-phosphoheptulonate synthase [Rhodothermales bacterium]